MRALTRNPQPAPRLDSTGYQLRLVPRTSLPNELVMGIIGRILLGLAQTLLARLKCLRRLAVGEDAKVVQRYFSLRLGTPPSTHP
jgi:hypothetical protein